MRTDRKAEGYRYVRQYWLHDDFNNWALYERRAGRNCRVGTARTQFEADAFLLGQDDRLRVSEG